MFGVEAFPAAAFFVLLFLTPESPRWLVGAAAASTRPARSSPGSGADTENVDEEIREIQGSLDLDAPQPREPFFQKKYLRPILLAVAIATFNQLSGINALMYYAPRIFEHGRGRRQCVAAAIRRRGLHQSGLHHGGHGVIDHFGRRS